MNIVTYTFSLVYGALSYRQTYKDRAFFISIIVHHNKQLVNLSEEIKSDAWHKS